MFLSKSKSGIYYIYYSASNGKRNKISTKCRTKSAASIFFSNFNNELVKRERVGLIPIRLEAFNREYLKYSSLIHKYSTTKDIQSTLRQFQKFFNNPQLAALTSKEFEIYLEYRKRKSVFAAAKDYRYLKTIFKKAAADNYIPTNPLDKIKRIKTPEKQPLFFSEQDFKKLLDAVDNRMIKDIILLAVNTGMRREELLSLRWEQVNFKDRVLILNNRTHITKSNKIRPIPLNLISLQILNDRLLIDENKNYVFNDNGNKINGNWLTKKFKKYVIFSGINPQLKFHSLRHTFASWLIQRGVSIYEVSNLLGHSDIKVTEIYAHLSPDNLRSAVNILN